MQETTMRSGLAVGNRYTVECRDASGRIKWTEDRHNLITNEGLDDVLDKYLKGDGYTAAWYVGLIDNADFGALAAGDTAAKITNTTPNAPTTNNWAECEGYSEEVRQTLTLGSVSSQSVSNTASKATFSINATKTINGAFVASASGKHATTGVLYGVVSFGTPRALLDGDTLYVTVTGTSANAT